MTGLALEQKQDTIIETIFNPHLKPEPPIEAVFDKEENIYEDDYPEIEMIEIPVVKRMVFKFKEPVEMEFS